MASVAVSIEQYRDGLLPHVCVVSGVPTENEVVVRSAIRKGGGSGWAAALDGLVEAVDVRRPRDVLMGRLPMAPAARRRLLTARRMWSAFLLIGFLGVGASAWAAATWSPFGAGVGGVVVVVAWWRRRIVRRSFPRSTLTHGGTLVTVDNVHEAFAAAVGGR